MSNPLEELQLQQYRPRSMGAWSAFVIIGAYIALVWLAVAICLRAPGSTSSLVAVILIVMAAGARGRWAIQFLAQYGRRNIRGYNLWCVRKPDGSFTYRVQRRYPETVDRSMANTDRADELTIIVPLGGWSSSAWAHIGRLSCDTPANADFSRKELAKSRFTKVEIHEHTGVVIIRWHDHRGDRLTMNVEVALQRLHEYATYYHLPRIALTLWDFTNNERNAWLSMKGQYEEEHQRRLARQTSLNVAKANLLSAAREIAESVRFGRSRDGKRIRQQLANTVLGIMQRDDPDRAEAERLAEERVPVSVAI